MDLRIELLGNAQGITGWFDGLPGGKAPSLAILLQQLLSAPEQKVVQALLEWNGG